MIWLRPESVVFEGVALPGVESVVVDRGSARVVEEWGDDGPHAVFADVPRRRVTVRVTRTVTETEALAPEVGALGSLSFTSSRNASAVGRVTVTVALAVVTGVSHTVGRGGGSRQVVELCALSPDGVSDPVSRSAA